MSNLNKYRDMVTEKQVRECIDYYKSANEKLIENDRRVFEFLEDRLPEGEVRLESSPSGLSLFVNVRGLEGVGFIRVNSIERIETGVITLYNKSWNKVCDIWNVIPGEIAVIAEYLLDNRYI